MTDIVLYRPQLPVSGDFNQARTEIVNLLSFGTGTRETALFVIYRIWRDNLFIGQPKYGQTVVYDDNGIASIPDTYRSFDEFVHEVSGFVEISRSTIYNRLRVYSLLEWLEYTEAQSLLIVAARPSMIDKVLSAIFLWDRDSRLPIGVKTAEFGLLHDSEFKKNVRKFIDSLEAFETTKDALDHLQGDIIGSPKITFSVKDNHTVAMRYETQYTDPNTGESTPVYGSISLFADEEIPEWVVGVEKSARVNDVSGIPHG